MHMNSTNPRRIGTVGPSGSSLFTVQPGWSTCLLLGALLALLHFLRSPQSLLHPQFWAEDGTLYFQQAHNQGFLSTLLKPASGYLHAFPRLVAGLALLLPMERAPLVFNLSAFLLQLIPGLYLLSPRMSHLIPSRAARVAAALLYIALPASYETHVNLTNSHWYLTLTAVCILSATPALKAPVRMLESLLLVLFSLTGPFSVLFLPLVAPRLLRALRGAPTDRGLFQVVVIAAGALVQTGFALTSARIAHAVPLWGNLTLQELLTAVSMHTFFNAIFGINGCAKIYRTLPATAYGLGLLALGFLVFVALRDRVAPLLTLLYLSALSIVLSFVFPLNDPRLWLHPQAGPRYFLFACLFIHISLLHLALAARSLRSIGVVLLAFAALVGIPADFRHPRQPDVRWADHIAVFQSLPDGSDFTIPVAPLYHAGMVLRKATSERGPSPLSGLRPIESATPAALAVGRPRKVLLNDLLNDRFLSVSGWALDGATGKAAGGVYVLLDDRLFPAPYGLPADLGGAERSCADCGFSRLIPVTEIGPGSHRVSIVVLSRDGKAYYRPTEPRAFAMNQFFP